MRLRFASGLFVGSLLLLAACRGGGPSPLPSSNVDAPLAKAAGTGTGTLVIALPAILLGSPSPNPASYQGDSPNDLSAGTRVLFGSFGPSQFGPIALDSASGCVLSNDGSSKTCTITVSVPAGKGTLLLQTFGAKHKAGALARAAAKGVRVFPNTPAHPPALAWTAVARSLRLSLAPAALTQGQLVQANAVAYGVDSSGSLIPSTLMVDPNGVPLTLSLVQTGPYPSDSPIPPYRYDGWGFDGVKSGVEKFTLKATEKNANLPPATGSVTIAPGSTQIEQIIVGSGNAIVEFPLGASGNVAPARVFGGGGPSAAQPDGSFWSGGSQYSNTGVLLHTIKPANGYLAAVALGQDGTEYAAWSATDNPSYCSNRLAIQVYAPGSYGSKLLRQFTYPGTCGPASMTVGASGTLYVAENDLSGDGTIWEMPSGASGTVSPTETIQGNEFNDLDVDGSGNLYVLDGGLLESYPAGSTTPVPVLAGTYFSAVTLDAQGNIYAVTSDVDGTLDAIEEVPRGSTTPTNVIAGSNTMLTRSTGITIVPSTTPARAGY